MDLGRNKNVLRTLSVLMMEMVVSKALSVIRMLYPDLERSEDVTTALPVLVREMDEFRALSVKVIGMYWHQGGSEGTLMALFTRLLTGTTSPGFLLHERRKSRCQCLNPPLYLSMPVVLHPSSTLTNTPTLKRA